MRARRMGGHAGEEPAAKLSSERRIGNRAFTLESIGEFEQRLGLAFSDVGPEVEFAVIEAAHWSCEKSRDLGLRDCALSKAATAASGSPRSVSILERMNQLRQLVGSSSVAFVAAAAADS